MERYRGDAMVAASIDHFTLCLLAAVQSIVLHGVLPSALIVPQLLCPRLPVRRVCAWSALQLPYQHAPFLSSSQDDVPLCFRNNRYVEGEQQVDHSDRALSEECGQSQQIVSYFEALVPFAHLSGHGSCRRISDSCSAIADHSVLISLYLRGIDRRVLRFVLCCARAATDNIPRAGCFTEHAKV